MKNFLLALTGFLVAILFLTTVTTVFGVTLPNGTALFETSLQDRITSTDTSMTLVANSVKGSQSISGYNCFTLDEGRTDSEYVCGTVSGTSVTGLERGLSLTTGTSTVAALQFAHRKGADVKITDFPLIQRLRNQNNGTESYPNSLWIDGGLTLGALASYASALSITPGSNQLATALYADSIANQGAATSSESAAGITRLATQLQMASSTNLGANTPLALQAKYATSSPGTAGLWAVITNNAGKIAQGFLDWTQNITFSGSNTHSGVETFAATTTASANTLAFNIVNNFTASTTIVAGQPVFIATSTGAIQISQANVATTTYFDGFAKTAATNGNTVVVQTGGIVTGLSGLIAGTNYYVTNTRGTLSATPGTTELKVGRALSATTLLIQPGTNEYMGSAGFGNITNGTASCLGYATSTFSGATSVIVDAVATGSGGSSWGKQSNISLRRFGATSGTDSITVTDQGPTVNTAAVTVTWDTTADVIRLNGSSSINTTALTCSGTVYFYR